jgi:hypothetical protein
MGISLKIAESNRPCKSMDGCSDAIEKVSYELIQGDLMFCISNGGFLTSSKFHVHLDCLSIEQRNSIENLEELSGFEDLDPKSKDLVMKWYEGEILHRSTPIIFDKSFELQSGIVLEEILDVAEAAEFNPDVEVENNVTDEDPLEFAIEYSKSSRKCNSNDCEDKIKKVMSKAYTGGCHDWTQAKRCQEAHLCPCRLPIRRFKRFDQSTG